MIKVNCINCSKEFYVHPYRIKKGEGKYCSRKCYGEWITKNYYREKASHWKGGGVKRECECCKKDFYVAQNVVKKGYGLFCSRSCMDKSKQGPKTSNWKGGKIKQSCLWCGKDFFVDRYMVNKGHGRFCSYRCLGSYNNKYRMPNKDTSIEIAIEQELQRRNIKFLKQYPIKEAHTVVDFMLNNKVIIYCDGDYWHNLPKTKKRDSDQDFILGFKGYMVFRLKEKDIKNNPSKCIDSILERILIVQP